MMSFLRTPFIVLILTQVLYSISDLMGRAFTRGQPFTAETFLTKWFLVYFLVRQIAMFGQLYTFSAIQLGKTMALFASVSIIFSNLLGFFLLGEVLNVASYVGVTLAVTAFVVLAAF